MTMDLHVYSCIDYYDMMQCVMSSLPCVLLPLDRLCTSSSIAVKEIGIEKVQLYHTDVNGRNKSIQ